MIFVVRPSEWHAGKVEADLDYAEAPHEMLLALELSALGPFDTYPEAEDVIRSHFHYNPAHEILWLGGNGERLDRGSRAA